MTRSMTLRQIAELVHGEVRGDPDRKISQVASVRAAEGDCLTWVSHGRYVAQLGDCRAGAVLVQRDFGPTPMPAILCDNIDQAVVDVLAAFAPELPGPAIGVHATAQVAETAVLGANVAVGENVVIAGDVRIGEGTVLYPGVAIGTGAAVGAGCRLWYNVVVRERCTIGDRVTIHSNTVIGSDGFGFQQRGGRHVRVPHIGAVRIGNDVEIGACCCVDRSKVGETVVGDGTKIDNLVQIAHNVVIGVNCLVCAQAGIAGSTRLGDYVVLGGQVGLRDNIVLQDGVVVAACSSVAHDVPAGTMVAGRPAVEGRRFKRENATVRKLPELVAQLRELIRRVERLETAADDKSDG